jgi:hypothetical protein
LGLLRHMPSSGPYFVAVAQLGCLHLQRNINA